MKIGPRNCWTFFVRSGHVKPILPAVPACRTSVPPWHFNLHNSKGQEISLRSGTGILSDITKYSLEYKTRKNITHEQITNNSTKEDQATSIIHQNTTTHPTIPVTHPKHASIHPQHTQTHGHGHTFILAYSNFLVCILTYLRTKILGLYLSKI